MSQGNEADDDDPITPSMTEPGELPTSAALQAERGRAGAYPFVHAKLLSHVVPCEEGVWTVRTPWSAQLARAQARSRQATLNGRRATAPGVGRTHVAAWAVNR